MNAHWLKCNYSKCGAVVCFHVNNFQSTVNNMYFIVYNVLNIILFKIKFGDSFVLGLKELTPKYIHNFLPAVDLMKAFLEFKSFFI